jgi:hypothetical protein
MSQFNWVHFGYVTHKITIENSAKISRLCIISMEYTVHVCRFKYGPLQQVHLSGIKFMLTSPIELVYIAAAETRHSAFPQA